MKTGRIIFVSLLSCLFSLGFVTAGLPATAQQPLDASYTIETFPAGGDYLFDLASDGANIWVTNDFVNTVTKLRASDGVILGTFDVGVNPRYITFDGTNIWIGN